MRYRRIRKLTISRETLGRLEGSGLKGVAGGQTELRSVCACPTDRESFCICPTELCVTLAYTNCNLCVE